MLRIAMWSGPRNISTAMMRAWENRPDTIVCDEPLYAHYLQFTGLPHPGAEEVIAHHETDWRVVVERLLAPLPSETPIYYQKQMAHHLLPHIEWDWLDELAHCFLIREPREMLTSLLEFLPEPTLRDTGLPQQVEIFQRTRARTGATPPVLDARDVLAAPRAMLTRLCNLLGVEFCEEMLRWPPGPRESDGVWARYWYAKVHETTAFGPYRPKAEPVPRRLRTLLADCDRLYQELAAWKLLPD